MTHLNWYYIAVAMSVPPVIGLLLAFPFWWKGRMTLGNITGTVIVFGFAIGFILREYAQIDRLTQECLDAGTVCFPVPSA